ncbi:hypothetical protein ACFQ6U_29020 [Streptomyces sp. NPDC056465]|uniref:hypothetical protein n=1 Tax=Streptomyces sp. NPDC056465 TaxID=3345829 RepID=UPI0036B31449
MDTGSTRRTTVRRTLSPAIGTTVGTAVVDTGSTRRTTVRRTLSPAIGTAVVDTGSTRRTTVRRALVLVRVALGVGHRSSRGRGVQRGFRCTEALSPDT